MSCKSPKRPEFILHLGAQRTGSTRLQTVLDTNRDLLTRNGIVALTPPRPGKRISPTVRDVVRILPRKPKHLPRYILKRAGITCGGCRFSLGSGARQGNVVRLAKYTCPFTGLKL